jgi:phage head maturation protease
MEDIMDVLQIIRKGSIINTSVKFRIYKETKLDNRNKNK